MADKWLVTLRIVSWTGPVGRRVCEESYIDISTDLHPVDEYLRWNRDLTQDAEEGEVVSVYLLNQIRIPEHLSQEPEFE